ncbi:5-oxoprolinase subunit PxpB [Opitutus terrae]|uniref:Allophanate hydrolase subunit 1 n=1 Tax=Opitutus terrae (strain DSM 11246 / JCM 15787 / PB90-1) TaxID=452637 RepID=B1ZX54_OPITP|nr:5-oxoprolinase subunit PxpB [Opitutus terrae]ACB76106.1 Allophanate hydrolase subunit 1 [Opitutus terrae PB90-1]
MIFAPSGDSSVVVTLGATLDESTLARVRALAAELERAPDAGIIDVVPAYATVAVYYEPSTASGTDETPYQHICGVIEACAAKVEHGWPDLVRQKLGAAGRDAPQAIEIPVCYTGEFAPDLAEVARHCGLAPTEVSALHSGADYHVHAVGFSPGFAYLGGLPEKLFTPRRPTPRTQVPAGSVGIGWMHTGVYPLATPGGWQLIGRTPLILFRLDEANPARLRVGDHVKFRTITAEEFARWK